MFILHSSNKTEYLLEHLAQVLQTPLSAPLAEELFLIQSQGMERWLMQQLATRFTVCANVRFSFPGQLFSRLRADLGLSGDDSAFDRQQLLWYLEALLRNDTLPALQPLQHYLHSAAPDLKRYQLAQQLARLFDQYQLLRPDWLAEWHLGRNPVNDSNAVWQQALWQTLTAQLGTQHRGASWQQLIDYLNATAVGSISAALPERLSVFGINHMPPLQLLCLHALSRHCHIHLYLLNPVQDYWADVPSRRQLATCPDALAHHPLLVRMGQQGRAFQQMLLALSQIDLDINSIEAPTPDCLLTQLQHDIVHNRPATPHPLDASIGLHACHSRLREVQVLKNQLLDSLEHHADLAWRHVIVMAPNIQDYAPFISAVFSDIPHAIADRSLRIESPMLDCFLDFLTLSQSRLGWQSVLDFLERPLIHRSFALDEADLSRIRHWIQETHVRWGRSGPHKQRLGLPPCPQNTWQAMLDRLFMGYAVGNDADFVDDILPYAAIEGTASASLGGLHAFLTLLFQAGDTLAGDHGFADWQRLLSGYADQLFASADAAQWQPLHDLWLDLSTLAAQHPQPVSFAVLMAWLQNRMDESVSSHGFLRGQLTFCALLPMRAIPFDIVAVMGMNEGEFPHVQHSPPFDLLAQQPRLGDRSRRADERYQFLEVLLSARRQLLITYIGQSQHDNSALPPSVVVAELLDVLQQYGIANPVIEHPLHPFSPRYFDGSQPKLFSYVQDDCDTAQQLQPQAQQSPAPPWWHGSVCLDRPTGVALEAVQRFYQQPQRYFFQQHFGMGLPQHQTDNAEREPFAIDGLDLYHCQQQWIADSRAGTPPSLKKLQAQGLWPVGPQGLLAYQQQQAPIAAFIQRLQALPLAEAQAPLTLDICRNGIRLVGTLHGLYSNGSLLYRYSALKGKDYLAAWLHHLAVNQLRPSTTYLLGSDQHITFSADDAQPALLDELIALFLDGQQQPTAFFTEASWCYLQQKNPDDNPDKALTAVINSVQASIDKGYEPEMALLLQHHDWQRHFDATFIARCQRLAAPLQSAQHG